MWAKSTKVGFGYKGSAAVGLFCPKERKESENKCNICPKGGCTDTSCPKPKKKPPTQPESTVNTCRSASGNKVTIKWNV